MTEEGWKLFDQRIQEGMKVLMEAKKLKEECPHWYGEVLHPPPGTIGQELHEKYFLEGITKYPDYHRIYFAKVHFLQPQWGGGPGEIERFAEAMAKRTEASMGYAMYTRIMWCATQYYGSIFSGGGANWEKMKRGFYDIEKEYPDSSWNLNNFCNFACQANDKETAKKLFLRIGDKPYMLVWYDDMDRFKSYRQWSGLRDEAAK